MTCRSRPTCGRRSKRPSAASSSPTPSSSSASSTASCACATRCSRPTRRASGPSTNGSRASRRRASTSSRCATCSPRRDGTRSRRRRPLTDDVDRRRRAARYIEAYEIITGLSFSDWYGVGTMAFRRAGGSEAAAGHLRPGRADGGEVVADARLHRRVGRAHRQGDPSDHRAPTTRRRARARVEELCTRFLTNPVIEDAVITIDGGRARMSSNVGVVVFPGTNCEHDVVLAVERAGGTAELVWHSETTLRPRRRHRHRRRLRPRRLPAPRRHRPVLAGDGSGRQGGGRRHAGRSACATASRC